VNLGTVLLIGCVLAGGMAGVLIPGWIARLPEPDLPEGETKLPYEQLAAWPPLHVVTTVCTAFAAPILLVRLGLDPVLPAVLYTVVVGVLLAYVDIRVKLLPNAVILPSYPVVAFLLALAALASSRWDRLLWAAIGGAVLWGFFALLELVYPAGLGFGDVKLAGLLGLTLGWYGLAHLVVGVFGAFVLGGLTSLVLLAAKRAGRKTAIPFGPFLVGGWFVALLAAGELARWYLGNR
jgi:leader peptidase (prepilin peptidase)/N-methyltransferase